MRDEQEEEEKEAAQAYQYGCSVCLGSLVLPKLGSLNIGEFDEI